MKECSFSHSRSCTHIHTNRGGNNISVSLSCCFSAHPTSIKSTPKMIICLRKIILGKAIYRITIALLYPPSQTSSLECVCVSCVSVEPENNVQCICFCMPAFMSTHAHLSLSSSVSAKSFACSLFLSVHLHNCMVSLDSGSGSVPFKSTNTYSLEKRRANVSL